MRPSGDFLERALDRLAPKILDHPVRVVASFSLLAILGLISSLLWLEFETDQNALVSNELDYNRRYLRYLDEFGDQEYLYVVIDAEDLARAKRVADAISLRMQALIDEGLVKRCVHRLDSARLRRSALLLLPETKLENLARSLEHNVDLVRDLLRIDGLVAFFRTFLETAGSGRADGDRTAARLGLEALREVLATLERALDGNARQPPAAGGIVALAQWLESASFPGGAGAGDLEKLYEGDLLAKAASGGYFYAGGLLFVFIMPQKDFETLEVIREPLRRVREVLRATREEYPGVELGLTGRPVLQADEMETTNLDMTRAASVAMILVLVLFMLFFRAVRRPVLTALVLVQAIAITFGVVTVTVGHLNLLSIVFAIMLVSLGMDFGVHLIARYQEELSASGDLVGSMRVAFRTVGKGNITGATTTAAAFYTTLLVDFKGLSELGFIAGTGVLICMVAMNSLLPALLLLTDRRRLPRGRLAPLRMGFLVPISERPRITLPLCTVALLAGLPMLRQVSFDSNLLELQAEGLPSVHYEELITRRPGIKTWYAAYVAGSLEEVQRIVSGLRAEERQGVIGRVESVLDYVPPDQPEKMERIRALARVLGAPERGGAFPELPSSPAPLDIDALRDVVEQCLDRVESFLSASLRSGGEGVELLEPLAASLDRLVERLEEDPETAALRLGEFQRRWFAVVHEAVLEGLRLLDPVRITVDTLEPFLRERVRSPETGRYLVLAYPHKDIWVPRNMEEFVQTTREVSPEVTGVPVQVYESTAHMKRGFILAAGYALVAVFVLIWLDFRRVGFSVLAMVPVLLGMLATLELMPLLDMQFNLANFFAVPIIIGTGINGGVHIIHRFLENRSAAVATCSTGTSVILSELSTITAMGMLLTAHHRGVASLGGLMVLGCSSCLFVSVIVLPAILKLLERRQHHA